MLNIKNQLNMNYSIITELIMLTNSSTLIQQVANILSESFLDDPSFTYIFGDNTHKAKALNAFFEIFATDGIQRGKILIAPDEQGACIWYPAEVEIFNQQFEELLSNVIDTILEITGKESSQRFEQLVEKVSANEPKQKHCEVFFLGLKPVARNKGIGKSLLKPVLDYADTNQVGCYLVSSNARNLSFYERQGFQKYCSIEISSFYSMTGMWRNVG
ncbi:GCN5-related N-acetyltransferase [Gloeothece citriformis PCC 7424]|uniref:GCN5-related N-acetyltransferase n=1 Tax=Gloeothece citriformis (strain PCC 7424) TaxID=65393 RepID=B7K732_GLOC7|nr:GNAT family N-acetyltransferase [Gloeothece citriformis]ACK69600.1 GCN5-related N-acetyltransferase [Gloeothece citriformis PCC 7424]